MKGAAAAILLLFIGQAAGVVVKRSQAVTHGDDKHCGTGLLSLTINGTTDATVCCPSYCGECSDYPTCSSVRGQASENACCASQVYGMRCGGGAPANVCLKSCSESLPPCIMEPSDVNQAAADPAARNAGDDCNEAVSDWRKKAEAATTA
mmetsp:Transcript_56306/g.131959  ORF Transcript_56306/g.131959 Transcript_56306/m.131959 type:complete len:150 (-) Transcript_56306:52-501(-)